MSDGAGGTFTFDAPFDIVPALFRFEPPDIVVARPARPPTPEEMKTLGSFFREARDRLGGVFVLSILSGEVKRVGSSASLDMNRQVSAGMVKATAMVGADFHMRTAAQTQMRAAAALKLDFGKVLVEFFSEEREAYAWFEGLRGVGVGMRQAVRPEREASDL